MNKLALILITIGVVAITAGSFYTVSTGKNLRAPVMLEAAVTGSSGTQYCPTPQYRPDAWVNDFISKLKAFTFDSDQMTYLK